MEATAINNAEQDLERADEPLDVSPARAEAKTVGIFDEIDKQLLILSNAAAASVDTQCAVIKISNTPPLHDIVFLPQDERWLFREPRNGRRLRLIIGTGALLVAFGLGWLGGSTLYHLFDSRDELTGRAAINAVVERMIAVESRGDPNTKNKGSSATGLGQFLDETWLDMIRTERPDLAKGRNENEILELRRNVKLAREITTRFAERNAATLKKRGLLVTPGTIYLAHFAGGAGAVAILSAPENADAALVMASADATGRTTRDKIIKANRFLEHFTVSDLKNWADQKMRGAVVYTAEAKSEHQQR